MAIDVSIIIPIYKNAGSLARCLDSILAQDFQGTYEALLCADDSGDGSLQICEDYASRYPDKFILHHPAYRMGVSLARQEGYDMARGEYIYALDGDDELHPSALRILVDAIRAYDCDLVNCSFYTVKKKAKRYPFHRPTRVMDTAEAFSCFMADTTFRGFLWTKLFKASLLKEYPKIVLKKKNPIFEDVAFVASLLAHCKKVVNIPNPLYYYHLDNEFSETSRPRTDRAVWHLAVFASIRLYFDHLGRPDLIKAFRNKKTRMKWSLLFDLHMDKKHGLAKEERAKCLPAFKEIVGKEPLNIENVYYKEYVDGVIVTEKEAPSAAK